MNITPTYPAQRECPSLPSVLEVHPWTPDCKSLKPKVWCASFLRVWKALNSSPTWTKLVLSSQNYELPLRRPGQGPNFNLYKWTKKSKTNQIGVGWKRRKSRKQRQRRNFYYGGDSNETQLMLIEYLACARHWLELLTCINSDPHYCTAGGDVLFYRCGYWRSEELSDLSKATQFLSDKARLGLQMMFLTTVLFSLMFWCFQLTDGKFFSPLH